MEHIGVHCFTSNHLENIVNKYRSDYPQGIPPPNKNLCFFHWPHFPYLSSAKDKAARRPSLSSSSVISSRLAWSVNERFQAITLSDRRTVSESSVTLPPRRNPQCQLAGTLSATDAKTANEKRPHATNPKRRRRIPCVPIRAFLSLWGREQCYHVLQNKVCETKDLTFKLCRRLSKLLQTQRDCILCDQSSRHLQVEEVGYRFHLMGRSGNQQGCLQMYTILQQKAFLSPKTNVE